jgi:prepilin-type N-terminal cleavage/methylation domain-containing protein
MRRQHGFSMFEVLVVMLIVGIAGAIAVPKLTGYRDRNSLQQTRVTLESAWEDSQDYYRGQRGKGQDEYASSSVDGFDIPAAQRLNPKLTWTTDKASFTPAAGQGGAILIYRATNQVLALCSRANKQVMCKVDDGQTVNGRVGPRYGVSTASADDAVAHACKPSAQEAIKSADETCDLEVGDAGNDVDDDGVNDTLDNCRNLSNQDQANADSDVLGDLCDPAPQGAPVNVSVPTVSGTAREEQTLNGSVGVWAHPSFSYSYAWETCTGDSTGCTPLAGATDSNYTLTQADIGSYIRFVVTNTNVDGASTAYSASAGPVLPIAPATGTPPAITGTTQEASTLTASNGTWTNSPTGYTYQWARCDSTGAACSDIPGATSSTYLLASGDVDSTLRVTVTASNAGGSNVAQSNASSVVLPLAPANTAAPTVTGTPADGSTLTTNNGTWSRSPNGYAYQWLRCDNAGTNCVAIAGANATTYAAVTADVGATLRSEVTATNAGGSNSQRSNATAPVSVGAPVSTAAPAISGTLRKGQTISATTGTWSNSPASYTYQWRRCNSAGAACSDIPGATASSYLLTDSDIAATMRVVVTATNPGGSTPATSNPTTPIDPDVPTGNFTQLPGNGATMNYGDTATGSGQFLWNSSYATSTTCSIDGGAPGACLSGWSTSWTMGGVSHTVAVTLSNAAGTTTLNAYWHDTSTQVWYCVSYDGPFFCNFYWYYYSPYQGYWSLAP